MNEVSILTQQAIEILTKLIKVLTKLVVIGFSIA